MIVSGLVVSMRTGDAAGRLADAVCRTGPFTLGEMVDNRLTVALEADDPGAAERWHEWLRQLPGVMKVDVAFVYLDPVGEPTDVA